MILLDEDLWFPDVELADDDGLLAIGGDLCPARLLLAYRSGIFPWFKQQGFIFWFSPQERCVLFPDDLHISRSMKRQLNNSNFTITENRDFEGVIQRCATNHKSKDGSTWITKDFIKAYYELHKLGHAQSVEIWQEGSLVGGIYGVVIGNVFCGESMFSDVPNASKLALIHLCQAGKYRLIDCQVFSAHLESMGAKVIDREEFLQYLKQDQF